LMPRYTRRIPCGTIQKCTYRRPYTTLQRGGRIRRPFITLFFRTEELNQVRTD
jgi:hypothetical protein